VAMLAFDVGRWAVRPPYRLANLFAQLDFVGAGSSLIVVLTGLFSGMVFAHQSARAFELFDAESLVGPTVALTLTRELAPVFSALMVTMRAGSAMCTELGTMRVTEQVDALDVLGANPIAYLAVPRLLACVLLIPLLTLMADFMGIIGGAVVSTQMLGVDSYHYWMHSRSYVGGLDIFAGVFKSYFFGAAIALISCHRGFNCTAGAEGVGKAATEAFVTSFVAILFLDFCLGLIWNKFYVALWPNTGTLF
jgi:phospholipid/cholesterol/gamma-HCH transport system permease protein